MKKEEKKPVYVLCPRCELNYINKKDKHCTVCKAEMGLVDPSILIPDEEEMGIEKLCPVCRVNYIGEDEEICFLCQKEQAEHAEDNAPEQDAEWKEFDEDSGDDVLVEEIGLPLDEEESLFSDEEEIVDESDPVPDDFDFTIADDEDFDEDEDEEESEDEDFI